MRDVGLVVKLESDHIKVSNLIFTVEVWIWDHM